MAQQDNGVLDAPHSTEERVLRLREVISRTGRARSSIYADVKAGRFPTPIAIGARAVGWLETEVTLWLRERISASRQGGVL
jgi:prophage regulatory protein